MGVMRFVVEPEWLPVDWPEAYGGYISGLDGRVHPTRIELCGNVISCHRDVAESGSFHVAWPIAGAGRPILSTATLCEREEPYELIVELARGKVHHLTDVEWDAQFACSTSWQDFERVRKSAKQAFFRAVTTRDDSRQRAAHAMEALTLSSQAGNLLSASLTDLVQSGLRGPRPLSLGSRMLQCPACPEHQQLYLQTFNAVNVPIEWRMIEAEEGVWRWEAVDQLVEWALQHRLLIRGGPLFDLSTCGMPSWLWNGPCDAGKVQRRICQFVEQTIHRYMGRIRSWEVAARGNSGGDPAMNEEQRLGLVAFALDIARQLDEESQLLIRVDQPWGGYQARGQHRLSPLQFVDALLRCSVGLSAVVLELTVGYRPRGTATRDLLDLHRLLQQWSCLGLPLHIFLACPSASDTDRMVESELEVDAHSWKQPWTAQAQAQWIQEVMPVLMASKAVNGITWAHVNDGEPHEFPHAGLLGPDGVPKAAYGQIAGGAQVCG